MKKSKNIILWLLLSIIVWLWLFQHQCFAIPPWFENNFVEHLTNENSKYGNESVRDLSQIWLDKDKSIVENIKAMFYPDISGQGWKIRDIIKLIGSIAVVLALVLQWFLYVIHSDEEDKIKWYHVNFAYILLWSAVFFWATWILSNGLNLSASWGTTELLHRIDKWLLFQIFAGIRAAAFFTAIFMLWWYGRSMMSAMDDAEKVKTMRQGIINILVVLIVIKLIDYVYFIAQSPDFKSKATELLVEISKVLGYILGWFFTLSTIYYGFRLMFSGGNEEALTKVKWVITAVLLLSVVIFILFLIIYQVTQEFA